MAFSSFFVLLQLHWACGNRGKFQKDNHKKDFLSVAVSGRFVCGHAPALSNSTKVRIVDIDTGPDPDDTLDEKFVDANGAFKLNGYTRELTGEFLI